MGILLILVSFGLGIREEYRAQNGIVTKKQRKTLNEFAEMARRNEERRRQHQEDHEKRMKAIREGRWYG